MSAMPALDWPEDDPASWPVASLDGSRTADAHRDGSVRTRSMPRCPAARRSVPKRSCIQPARAQEPRAQALGSQALGSQAPRVNAAPAPLRLTRRGRIVLVAAAALLVTLLSLLATGAAASATSHYRALARRRPESRPGARPSRPEPLVGRGDRRSERRPPAGHAADHRTQRPVRRRDSGRPAAVGAPRLSPPAATRRGPSVRHAGRPGQNATGAGVSGLVARGDLPPARLSISVTTTYSTYIAVFFPQVVLAGPPGR